MRFLSLFICCIQSPQMMLTPFSELDIVIISEVSNRFVCRSGYLNDSTSRLRLINKPIAYTQKRKELSLLYLKERHGIVQKQPTIKPEVIVLHYTGGGSIESVFNYFNREEIEKDRRYNSRYSNLNVSAHYLVDRDGTVYKLLEDTLFARHTIGLNYCAIGIENIDDANRQLTPKQVEANALLIRSISQRYPIRYLIGHSEYGLFRKSKMWKETDAGYFTRKQDPGDDFMKQVREKIRDLNLSSTPDF